jgi:anthranilate phosphoribosyltransferase
MVAPLRREIGFRTFFNLLGVLLNPARPRFQMIGVAEPSVMRLYRYFLEDSKTDFVLVHTRDGYDEISLTAAFDAISNKDAETFYPEDLGYPTISATELSSGKTIETAAEQLLQILQNKGTIAQTNVVVANAAFAMQLIKPEFSFAECRERCLESLVSGKAFHCFSKNSE